MDLYYGLENFDLSNWEGYVVRIYFNIFFGNDFLRDLEYLINVGLDYGYILLLSMFVCEVVVFGCMI